MSPPLWCPNFIEKKSNRFNHHVHHMSPVGPTSKRPSPNKNLVKSIFCLTWPGVRCPTRYHGPGNVRSPVQSHQVRHQSGQHQVSFQVPRWCGLKCWNSMIYREGLFTQKILVHPPKKFPKFFKNLRIFLENLKSVHLIWEWTTPRYQRLNSVLFIKSSFTKRKRKNSEKI